MSAMAVKLHVVLHPLVGVQWKGHILALPSWTIGDLRRAVEEELAKNSLIASRLPALHCRIAMPYQQRIIRLCCWSNATPNLHDTCNYNAICLVEKKPAPALTSSNCLKLLP
jgi:hypothetical protein